MVRWVIVSMESELNCTSMATGTPLISALTSARFVPSGRSNMTLRTCGSFWSARKISILHRRCRSLSFSAYRHANGFSWAKYAIRDLPDLRMTGSPHSGQENGACAWFAKYASTISLVSFCLARSITDNFITIPIVNHQDSGCTPFRFGATVKVASNSFHFFVGESATFHFLFLASSIKVDGHGL